MVLIPRPVPARLLLAGLALLGLVSAAGGAPVRERMPSGLYAMAEYRPGMPRKPAVLILHGFLSTHNFNTVWELVSLMEENGNTVLAPTLTLGINARRQGLACDAIHTQTVDQDRQEIAFWVDWLARQGHDRIILIGHSFGSNSLLDYLQHPNPAVKRLIATSLSHADAFNPPQVVQQQIAAARAQLAQDDRRPGRYTLSYCRENFVAPPEVYLSYLTHIRPNTLAALRHSPVPVTVIMGGADDRYPGPWLNEIRASGAGLIVIPGANHFFDAQHEFELHDAILKLLWEHGGRGGKP
jgi:pimeloyl-ACP methyl ester carboxylesterase